MLIHKICKQESLIWISSYLIHLVSPHSLPSLNIFSPLPSFYLSFLPSLSLNQHKITKTKTYYTYRGKWLIFWNSCKPRRVCGLRWDPVHIRLKSELLGWTLNNTKNILNLRLTQAVKRFSSDLWLKRSI